MSAWYNKTMAFPGSYNIDYYEGDTLEFNVSPENSAGGIFSLSGYSASFTIATSRGPNPSQSVVCTAEKDENNTMVLCTITPTQGRQLVAGTQYVYDVQITNGSKVYTLLTGTISVTADVTGA